MKTQPLFPSDDAAIAQDRMAAARERKQRARDRIQKRDIVPLITLLLDQGPMELHQIISELPVSDDFLTRMGDYADAILDLDALWRVGKLWRRDLGVHPCSGQMMYRFGIRGVHPVR